jgi:hypothetical protein
VALFRAFWCATQQSTLYGGIENSVTDSTGLNASPQILNAATGVSRNVMTDANGSFRAVGLPIATYPVRVSTAGFARYAQIGIVLAAVFNGHMRDRYMLAAVFSPQALNRFGLPTRNIGKARDPL